MKAATIVGILLIVLGIIGFASGGLSFTHQKKDVDVGPIQLSHKETNTLPMSPILSTLSLVAGLAWWLWEFAENESLWRECRPPVSSCLRSARS